MFPTHLHSKSRVSIQKLQHAKAHHHSNPPLLSMIRLFLPMALPGALASIFAHAAGGSGSAPSWEKIALASMGKDHAESLST